MGEVRQKQLESGRGRNLKTKTNKQTKKEFSKPGKLKIKKSNFLPYYCVDLTKANPYTKFD